MRRIMFVFPGLDRGRLFDPSARDRVTEPFIHLRGRVRELGFELATWDGESPGAAEQIWFWDVPAQPSGPRARLAAALQRRSFPEADLLRAFTRSGRGRLLIVGEPPAVRPDNWDKAAHRPFGTVLTWADDLVDNQRYAKFRLPIPSTYPRLDTGPFRQRALLVNISANKASSHPAELYSARRQTIRFFERELPTQFALYGPGWDRPMPGETRYSSYRGVVANKWELYPKFRFGLCYENMRNTPGYVTEKLFDCARAGSVPVYWGAPNIGEYVDPEVFVDRTQFESEPELARFLADIGESEHSRYVEAARDYFLTSRFAAFLPPAFADAVIGAARLSE